MINSAMGPLAPDKLGTTLVHEHFCFAYPGWFSDVTMAPYDPEAVLQAGLAQGVSIGFDRLGLSIMYGIPDEIHLRNIAILCKEGYASKIMLSHDTANFWLGRPMDVPEQAVALFKDWRIDHVSRDIVPALK